MLYRNLPGWLFWRQVNASHIYDDLQTVLLIRVLKRYRIELVVFLWREMAFPIQTLPGYHSQVVFAIFPFFISERNSGLGMQPALNSLVFKAYSSVQFESIFPIWPDLWRPTIRWRSSRVFRVLDKSTYSLIGLLVCTVMSISR